MERTTVDFGIDLGTTNSEIAVLQGVEPEVIPNNEGGFWTPSVVWIDERARLYTGRRAYERIEQDPENTAAEFKLSMGTDRLFRFAASDRAMKSEQLSAEILKSLRSDVQRRLGDEVRAAVVTVPADFVLPQCEATARAASLAGIEFCTLLQEPIAAGLAYGFQSERDNVFWMVYDLGGGTFDTAVVLVRDGLIQVAGHGGDRDLGGKLIDWDIVNKLLVPGIVRNYRLPDFRRGNPRWRAAFAKLKLHAELAKIRLSQDESADVFVDPLCQDDAGQWVRVDAEITRSALDPVIAPYVERTIRICEKVLAEQNLRAANVERLILVGGPTLTPLLRKMLAERVGIALEHRVDPLTVVARGAAIFAGTQRVPADWQAPAAAGEYSIQLEFKPVTHDPQPWVGGIVQAPEGQAAEGCTIELVEARSEWRSGQIRLGPDGSFMTPVTLDAGRDNRFLIELRDASGTLRPTRPDSVGPMKTGLTPTDPPLIHSLGVAMADGTVLHFLDRGTPLPARWRERLRTTVGLQRGQSGSLLRIPVVEGEHEHRADRNWLVGYLDIPGANIRRDVPAGSEVEVALDVDQSRRVTTHAYLPLLDEEFEKVLELKRPTPEPAQLAQEFQQVRKRLEDVRKKQEEVRSPEADRALQRINREQAVEQIETALSAATDDPEAALKCDSRLQDLKVALDEAEDEQDWPLRVKQAGDSLKTAKDLVQQAGDADERSRLPTLEREVNEAIRLRDRDLLERKQEDLWVLIRSVLFRHIEFWEARLSDLRGRRSQMSDQAKAQQLFLAGSQAVSRKDVGAARNAVVGLMDLLPPEAQADMQRSLGSGVERFF